MCVTGPGTTTATAVERAVAVCEAATGLTVVQVQADTPRDRSAMLRALYTALGLDRHRARPRVLADAEELIAAELRRSARLVIVPDAHQLRTTALELLYGLWAHGVPDRFPLVLAGDDRLEDILQRPALANLESHVFIRHRLTATSQEPLPAAVPGPETAAPAAPAAPAASGRAAASDPAASGRPPATSPAAAVPAAPGTDSSAPSAPVAPAAPVPVAAAAGGVEGELATAPGAAASSGDEPVSLLVSAARPRLYQLVDAASDEGRVTLIWKGKLTAALIPLGRLDPQSRARVGSWPSWPRTKARPKLGDLVTAAAGTPDVPGVPQVLCDRTTPVAVLLDAALLPAAGGLIAVPGGPGATDDAPPTPGLASAAPAPATAAPGKAVPAVAGRAPEATTPPTTAPAAPAPVPTDEGARPAEPGHVPAEAGPASGAPAAPATADDVLPTAPDDAAPAPDGDAAPAPATPAPVAPGRAPEATVSPASAAEVAPAVPGAAPAAPDDAVPAAPGADVTPPPADTATAAPTNGAAPAPPALATTHPDSAAPVDGVVPAPDTTTVAAPGNPARPGHTDPAPSSSPSSSAAGPRLLQGLGDVLGDILAPPAPAPAAPAPRAGGPLAFGLPALDRALAALTPGRLTLIAAPPGAGGSLLAVAAASHTALTHQLPVLYAASGLTRADVGARIIAAQAPADYRRLRTGALDPGELQAVASVHERLAGAALLIDDGTGLTAEAIAETVPDVEGLALVVIDRLQHTPDPAVPLSGPSLPAAARVLDHLARTHHVPVVAVLDTDDPATVAALNPGLTLTLTRDGERAELAVAERDYGRLAVFALTADMPHARFTTASPTAHDHHPDSEAPPADLQAPHTLTGPAHPPTPSQAVSTPHSPAPDTPAATPDKSAEPSGPPAPAAAPGNSRTDTTAGATEPTPAPAADAADADLTAAEDELLEAARPFTSGAQGGLSARLTGAMAALRDARTAADTEPAPAAGAHQGQAAGALPGLRQHLADLAARAPRMPDTPEGARLGSALTAYTAAHNTPRTLPPTTPAPAAPAASASAPATGAGRTATPAPDAALAAAETELLDAAAAFTSGPQKLSATAVNVLYTLRDAQHAQNTAALPAARARAAELATRRLRLPHTPDAARLRAALDTYATTAAAAGITPDALPPAPAAVLSVAEPTPPTAQASQHPADTGAAAAPETGEDPEEVASVSFQDEFVPPEEAAATGGSKRDYTFFLNKITNAVEQALQEHDGDVDAATKALVRKAVPDSMALFKLTRVGGNYVHTAYPRELDFLAKPSQGEPDEVWEARHKWRNEPLAAAIKKGTHDPVDVTALDTNAAYLSAFKTHLPIGTLLHNPTGGFDRRQAGIHRVDHFEWNHPHLPSPLGNRIEPGPYYLDEATLRLLIRCHELDLCEAPRILESWTSGSSEAMLEKFRRVLQQARQTAIENEDTATIEYVKAMYSKFTSTIGHSAKNSEIRRPEWVHTIRSQANASLWLKAWKAHQNGLILVQVSGVDELHVTGGDWRQVFTEGRMPAEMKEKRLYTLGGK
ncbi:DnaB-like helicase C-terminal domain-containing protein [Streptomyces netropsis]|uniref:DnaB-like helicase C-terminal domain-containing protein n=1 Tax=Streptomyces netropsis TaxID=55404 RepID=UPI0037B09C15